MFRIYRFYKYDNHLDLYKSIIKTLKKFLKKVVEEIDEEIIELIKKSRLAKCKSLNNFYNSIRSLENITKKPIWSLTQGKYQHFSYKIISRQFFIIIFDRWIHVFSISTDNLYIHIWSFSGVGTSFLLVRPVKPCNLIE